ncbi:hypothetical protein [Notoacmeibacter sp. MSK16QG-6]|uniref:hypothetical protein n=1 Tax=Notoacmeibacter sp. MSK16QG-6 TaxID=2957982 RepID=UPI00209D53DD|nr:hypothetical protein [Notoacmeibacter sp. MSK16QG-6]MCP1200027.1 hypothetical protein [Notoacmeibacter sp. MSK16QG-6]
MAYAQTAEPSSQTIIVATPKANGKGAEFRTIDRITVQSGLPDDVWNAPDDASIVILEEGMPPRWSRADLDDIDRQFGGNGEVEVELDHTPRPPRKLPPANKTEPVDLSKLPGKASEELFDREGFRSIQPADGTWVPELVSQKMTGCTDMLAGVMKQQIPPSKAREMTFSKPFDPTSIGPGFARFSWKKTGPNSWTSTIVEVSPETTGEQIGMTFSNRQQIEIRNASTIGIRTQIKLKLAPHLAKMIGGGKNCRVYIEGLWQRPG